MSKIVGPLISRVDFTQAEVQENCIIRKPEGINRAEIEKLIEEKLKAFGSTSVKEQLRVGDAYVFGSYPQGARGEVKPIEWRVLAVEGNRALLISKYALDSQRFHKDESTNQWKDCTLHSWLNEDFYRKAFNGEEQKKIQQTPLKDAGTTDKVFLLSTDEAKKYFSDEDDRRCVPTGYAAAQGAYQSVDDTTANGVDCWWWLRSSYIYYDAGYVNTLGLFDGTNTLDTTLGVRPALWVEIPCEQRLNSEQLNSHKDISHTPTEPVGDDYGIRGKSREPESIDVLARHHAYTFTRVEEPVKEHLHIGDTYVFGSYPQVTQDWGRGKPIEWRVLAVEGDKALLISRYALDCQKFHKDKFANKWKNCTLHYWLNDDFYRRAFNEDEQKKIQQTPLNDVGTTDKVFLLSTDEANKYFADNDDRRCVPTGYAVAQGAYQSVDDTTANGVDCWWWLRSSYIYYDAGYVNTLGLFDGTNTLDTRIGVRPALWVKIS